MRLKNINCKYSLENKLVFTLVKIVTDLLTAELLQRRVQCCEY